MPEPMVTMTGPARLRQMAHDARDAGYLWLSKDLHQLAALWNGDLEQTARNHAELGRLQGAVETVVSTEPHGNGCRVVPCDCWQARLIAALEGRP